MNKVCTHNSFKINKVLETGVLENFQVIESFEKSTSEVNPWAQFVARELEALH